MICKPMGSPGRPPTPARTCGKPYGRPPAAENLWMPIRVHRWLLQPSPHPETARLSQPDRVRGEALRRPGSGRTSELETTSTRPDQPVSHTRAAGEPQVSSDDNLIFRLFRAWCPMLGRAASSPTRGRPGQGWGSVRPTGEPCSVRNTIAKPLNPAAPYSPPGSPPRDPACSPPARTAHRTGTATRTPRAPRPRDPPLRGTAHRHRPQRIRAAKDRHEG